MGKKNQYPLMNKKLWLDFAESLDALRVLPRLIIIAFVVLYSIITWDVWIWFKGLEFIAYDAIQLAAILGFPGLLLSALGGIIMKIFIEYMKSGRNWNEENKETEVPTCPSCGRPHL